MGDNQVIRLDRCTLLGGIGIDLPKNHLAFHRRNQTVAPNDSGKNSLLLFLINRGNAVFCGQDGVLPGMVQDDI